LLLVVPTARARPGISLTELAAALACEPDDLRKDIGLLACVGSPPFQPDDLIDIELRDDRVFVALPQAFDRPARLSWMEAVALTLAASMLSPGDAVARSAVVKLRQAVAPAQQALFDTLLRRVPAVSETSDEIEATLRQAIRERRVTEIVYFARTDLSTRPRRIQPRALATAKGLRYLSARKDDGAERQYRVDRISRATVLDERFRPLPDFDLRAALKRLAEVESSPDFPRATVRFEPSAARAALARHPGAKQKPDGSVEVALAYSTVPWLVSYVLSWGGQAVITAPAEARDALRRAVDDALAALKPSEKRPS
jgi:proteasome accessory factor C